MLNLTLQALIFRLEPFNLTPCFHLQGLKLEFPKLDCFLKFLCLDGENVFIFIRGSLELLDVNSKLSLVVLLDELDLFSLLLLESKGILMQLVDFIQQPRHLLLIRRLPCFELLHHPIQLTRYFNRPRLILSPHHLQLHPQSIHHLTQCSILIQ